MILPDFLGIFFIILGFLVKRFPNLIAGYNTLPPEKKEKVDVKGLSSMMRNVMITMGLLLIITNQLSKILGFQEYQVIVILFIVLIFTLLLVILAQFHMNDIADNSIRSRALVFGRHILLLILFVVPIGLILYGSKLPNYIIEEGRIEISGIYGLTADIKNVKRLETIPKILERTNGFAMGSTKRGDFNLEEFGQCKLFLESMDSPFIHIEPKDGVPVIINTEAKAKTEELFIELQKQVLN